MIPCRCNRRECQGRRNLKKRPEEYTRWPKCRKCKEGKLYVDEYRLKKGAKDRAQECTSDSCRVNINKPTNHRVDNKGCIHYEEYVLQKSIRGIVKNSPFQNIQEQTEAPF